MSVADEPRAGGDGGLFVGRAMKRKEDPRLITGRATYVDDITLVGQLWMAFVRSPEAHARIVSIDASAAEARDGRRRGLHRRGPGDLEAPLPMAWVPPGVEVSTPEHWPLAARRGQARGRSGRRRPRRGPLRRRRRRRGGRRRVRARCRSSPTRRRRCATRRSSTRRSARTRSTSGRSAAATSRPASPRPTSSSSGGSSTTARPAAPIEPRAVLAEERAGHVTIWSHDPDPALPAPLPGAHARRVRGARPRRSRPRSAAASARSCRSTARRSSRRGRRAGSAGPSSGSRPARST